MGKKLADTNKVQASSMSMDELIARINALYHKSKAEGLTNEESKEQKELRSIYITNIRANLRGQLNNISVENPDGTVINLGETYGNKSEDKN